MVDNIGDKRNEFVLVQLRDTEAYAALQEATGATHNDIDAALCCSLAAEIGLSPEANRLRRTLGDNPEIIALLLSDFRAELKQLRRDAFTMFAGNYGTGAKQAPERPTAQRMQHGNRGPKPRLH
ncbi:MAG: hypothetical protein EKK41_15405 [Hyphomicrobiales bacterium]|nr:MAG: hypothetical protein EKK41_15405 [Hyphomicrobiales bacterium]